MVYVALLRGINVGGKNLVDMKRLKSTFERAGMAEVSTYINSGNILFRHKAKPASLVPLLERAIARDCRLPVKVLLRDLPSMKAVAKALPHTWTNDDRMKCDVMFLWETFDRPDVVEELTVKPAIDDVRYVPGAVLWRVDRKKLTRSGMTKVVGTQLYRGMTVRNCNTVRKLAALMEAMHEA